MTSSRAPWPIALGCFALSGFAGLVYQTTWLRQTMALFGATTPTVAVMLAIFMAGLTLGSFAAGRWVRARSSRSALLAYAGAECLIAVGGLVALPIMLGFREAWWWLHAPTLAVRWLVTFAALGVALLPWTFAMGATFPLFLGGASGMPRLSFGWLYAANVGGAMAGTLLAGFVLFEYLGFARTQSLGVLANGTAVVLALGLLAARRGGPEPGRQPAGRSRPAAGTPGPGLLAATFWIGFVSLGSEVVWTRIYTPVLGTVVYAFTALLATYLGATLLGTLVHRWATGRGWTPGALHRWLGPLVVASGFLPFVAATHAPGPAPLRVILGLGPFCFLTGLWTPLLVEEYAQGEPARVGWAYAWNGLGCLVGPLAAGFLLLPLLGARLTLLALAALLVVPAVVVPGGSRGWGLVALLAVAPGFVLLPTFEERIGSARILHDATATTAAWGTGRDRRLLVNGISMTALVSETKWMVHLPGAVHGRPRSILVICFGMGTSFRSALAWDARVTAVELVPSVPRLFPFFHPEGERVLRDPRGRVVIDDGRHFLETTRDRYDVVVVDPPPPLTAAGSSLLNSRQFLAAARGVLNPGGVLLHWTPGGDLLTELSQVATLADVFPYLEGFRSPGAERGIYLLASREPLRIPEAGAAVDALPRPVRADLEEWIPAAHVVTHLEAILRRRISRGAVQAWTPGATPLTDDFPVNEYFWVRDQLGPAARAVVSLLGHPPVVRRLGHLVQERTQAVPAGSFRHDPEFVLSELARTLHRYDLAGRGLERLVARHPDRELRDLLDEVVRATRSAASLPGG